MNRDGKKLRRWCKMCMAASILLVLILAELFYSNLALSTARYAVRSSKLASPIRVVFLSDLHGREFGKSNRRLLEKIAANEPDVIVLAGDMIEAGADGEEIERVCAFVSAAKEIAPVWYGLGNHEYRYIENHGAGLEEKLTEAGAVVLEAEYADIDVGGTPVRIGGYAGYYRTAHLNTKDPEKQAAHNSFFEGFEDTERFKLLINHIPTNWLDWDYRDKYPVDLVLSGHYHGGLVRFPLIGKGLYAPYVGWFPPYTKGCFEGEAATCILSSGLAGANGVPRFFNTPEIVVIDVVPDN
ncbi:MAG: metallophosphoesterase [Clostridia bacterium]|nr:metallophosphoesterase [Clostridia bacterium]